MKIKERTKLYIWLYSFKYFNKLKKYGFIHYSSRKMNYVVMYVDADQVHDRMKELEKLSFVREVNLSPQKKVDLSFANTLEEWRQYVKKEKRKSKTQVN